MPAKKIEKLTVVFYAKTEDEARMILGLVGPGFGGQRRREEFVVCSHCGDPWPVIVADEQTIPLPESAMVLDDPKQQERVTYCCEATRLDCEGSND
jgi:hypothetical protein